MKRTTTAEAAHFTVRQIFGLDSAVRIESTIDPVSLQADSDRKKTFQAALAEAIRDETDRIFTGDVKAEITWYVSEERRYGTHIVADIDNIVKPLFDAVTGPDGIMIDDNQVQQFGASWVDAIPGNLKFSMEVRALSPLEFIKRDQLDFVDFGKPYGCMLYAGIPDQMKLGLIQNVAERIRLERALLDANIAPDVAKTHMPIQRFFPSARLNGFNVSPLPEAAGTLKPDSQTIPGLASQRKDIIGASGTDPRTPII